MAKILRIIPITRPPRKVENIIFQLPTLVYNKINAPIKIAKTDVSPTDHGINPKNISETLGRFSIFPAEASAKGVAPEKPSTIPSPPFRSEIQT